MGVPRKRNVDEPIKGMDWLERVSWGSYAPPLDARTANDTHLGTLAFMPDQSSQASVTESSVRQEDGPLVMRDVSSAYWSRLVFTGEEARE